MIDMFWEIIKYRDLLFMLTIRDIKIRYKQAVMGFIWAIFMPIIAVFAGILIKKAISMVSGKPVDLSAIASISVKVLPWTFFVNAIRSSVQSLIGNSTLVTKIYFPREVLPFSSILASLFDFSIAVIFLSLFLIFANIGASIYLLWIPALLIILIIFTTGLCLMFACANLFYRDVKYVAEIIVIFGIFFTPVFYEASAFGKWQILLSANPIGSILELLNTVVVLHKMPNIFWVIYTGICSILVFLLGLAIFHKTEPLFAENI